MSSSDILFKVIALYLLDRSEVPLSNAHICEFFVNGNYTDYFTALSVINALGESDLIDTKGTNNVTSHRINENGRKTLSAMMDRIGTDIKNEVESYLRLNNVSFRQSKEVYADYDRDTSGGFGLHLKATEDDTVIIDLHFHVGSEVQAKSICTNWKNNYEKVYEILMDELM